MMIQRERDKTRGEKSRRFEEEEALKKGECGLTESSGASPKGPEETTTGGNSDGPPEEREGG